MRTALAATQFFNCVFILALTTHGCKTSGDLASGRDQTETSEIQSIENPALTTQIQPGEEPQDVNQRLSMAEGELETLRAQTESEKEQLRLRIAELEKQNSNLQEEVSKAPAPATPPPSSSVNSSGKDPKNESDALWETILAQHRSGAHDKVLTSLDSFLVTYPKSKVQLEALALLALTQYKTQAYNDAAISFNSLIDKFPKRKEAALAWFGQACSFAKLKQSDSAQLIFGELIKRYPKSVETGLAKKILGKKDKIPADLFALSSNYPALAKIE